MADKEKSSLDLEALLEGHPILKQLLENIKQAVWLLHLDSGQILYVSHAFEEIWGVPCDLVYEDPFTLYKSIHPEDRVKVLSASLDKNRASYSQSYRIRRPDGSLRWISAHTFRIGEASPETAYQVFIAQDITEQHLVDETLRKALDRSREQFILSRRMSLARKPEAVLKTLMSTAELRMAARAFVLFFESPGRDPSHELDVIASWSPAPSRSYPVPTGSMNETILFDELPGLDLFHPSKPVIVTDISANPGLTTQVRDLLLDRQIHTVAAFPLIALGSWVGCLLVLFSQERHFDSTALRHIKVLVDQATITLYNLKLLKIEAESRLEAERANEIKTKFLAMISHELRTPLTSIRGFTTTLLAEDVVWEADEQRDFIQTIQIETNRLQELIDHLLDLSRLEAGMLPISLEMHTLQEIVGDALPQLDVMTHKHAFSIHLPAKLPPVLADAKRIAQVLVNLVHNAVVYSQEGTEIILTAALRRGFLQVSVIDQGPGIPPAEHKRVFQAFQRGIGRDQDGAEKGAGLGLAICKGLVEAHGGRIWIKKQTKPGTTVSFTIPLAPSNVEIAVLEKV